MINTKNLKETAAIVAAVAGIVGGSDKIKTTIQKWVSEYKGTTGPDVPPKEPVVKKVAPPLE